MNVNQKSLDVLSRNVSNSGTPGYHRQSLTVIDNIGSNSTYVRSGQVDRAFSKSLEAYYTREVSDSSFSAVRADFLDRLQAYMGKVGAAGSLDTQFNKFKSSLQSLSTSPDSYTVRAEVRR
jgi:flagellar hook-associated protein 1 FlgK